MQHWDRNTAGMLKRTSAPQEQECEVSLHSNQMEPPPEEQQSQQGIPRNSNAYMLMRDHIHPPRVSVSSCIVPPTEDVVVRPYLVPCSQPSMVWKMRIHTHTSESLSKFAHLSRRVQSIWICLS